MVKATKNPAAAAQPTSRTALSRAFATMNLSSARAIQRRRKELPPEYTEADLAALEAEKKAARERAHLQCVMDHTFAQAEDDDDDAPTHWICDSCGHANDWETATRCTNCKPVAVMEPNWSSAPFFASQMNNNGQWQCANCFIRNDAEATNCAACQVPRS